MMNLHNHTLWSDGAFSPEKLISYAEKNGIDLFAITDHYETTKVSSITSDKLNNYLKDIRQTAENYTIDVLVGIEIDFSSRTRLNELPYEIKIV